MTGLRWYSAAGTHCGNVRERNEDSSLVQPQFGLWAVADGMGGHVRGDVASQTVIEAISQPQEYTTLDQRIDLLAEALDGVNKQLINDVGDADEICGTTVAIFAMVDSEAACLWAGDSRIYLYRGGEFEQVTTDHVEYEESEDGEDLESDGETAEFLARAVGKDDELVLDLCVVQPQDGDRFLLCSDGLYGVLSDAQIKQTLDTTDSPGQATSRLVNEALDTECHDNVTVVVVDFEAWN
ncbi:MAG: PP2C family serine/threonine-protein phosphatase [Gammaproteobacteria bacterium]